MKEVKNLIEKVKSVKEWVVAIEVITVEIVVGSFSARSTRLIRRHFSGPGSKDERGC